MKSGLIVLLATVSAATAGLAQATMELADKLGCTNCHALDARKVGPPLKTIAAKYRGNSGAERVIVEALATGKGHPKVNAPEPDIAAVTRWVLAQ
jgi:cytochrome c